MRRRRRRPSRPWLAAVLRGVVFFAAAVFAGAGVSPAAAVAALRVVVALAGAALVVAAFAGAAVLAGADLAAAVLVAGALVAGVLRRAVLAVVVARLEAAAFLVVLVAAATPVDDGSIVTVMPWSPRARRTTRPRAGRTSAARMASATSRAGHRAGRGPLANEGLQGLVSELRRECARLGGLVGHRRHRLPFVADGRTPRAREATVRKRRGRSCATPGRGAGWCSAGVVTRCAHTL